MTQFVYETEVDVRWRDLDPLGHVNNGVYATYLELARLRYLRDEFDLTPEEPNFVVARLELDFRAPISEIDSVVVRLGVADVGRTSFRLAYEVVHGESVAARGESVQVAIDDDGDSTPLSEEWRRRLTDAADGAAGTDRADRTDDTDRIDGTDRTDADAGRTDAVGDRSAAEGTRTDADDT